MENYNYAPYYDRYSGNSQHREAGYTKLLAHPGRAEQAAEFNEIQSIQRDYLERLGNSLYRDGYIVSGCEINILDNIVTIASGTIFLDGLVRFVDADSLSIGKVGTEVVVATVHTEIVNHTQDPTLRDPAQGAENYNMAGADREKQTVVLSVMSIDPDDEDTLQDLEGAVIYTLKDGNLLRERETDDYSFITDTLAERTYDENGNYKVEGLILQSVLEDEGDYVRVNVSDGKAYVRGYQVSKPSMSSILVRKSTDTRYIRSESRYYLASRTRYKLSNGPISSVNDFTATVLVTGEQHFRSNVPGGSENLNQTPVQEIVSVYTRNSQGVKETIYQELRDYQLTGNTVDWSIHEEDSIEPTRGTTYYVDYKYNYLMEEGTDFEIENDGDDGYIVLLNGNNAKKPVLNSLMYFNYNYVLFRRDLILLDSLGNLSVLEGQPDSYANLITPYNGSPDYIELGYVNVLPTVDTSVASADSLGEVVSYDGIRFTQDNFATMMKRINMLEDSVAQLDMERNIEDGEDVTYLNGYFTDSFENINKSDLTYNSQALNVKYDACIDYEEEALTLSTAATDNVMSVNNNSSDAFNVYGDIISAPYTEAVAVRQNIATGTILVNPYASYGPMCQVTLSPAIDNWVDTNTIKINNTIENKTYTSETKVYSHGWWSRNATHNLGAYIGTETKTTTTYQGTSKSTKTTKSVASTVLEYMRQRNVNFTCVAFDRGASNVHGTFNGKPISLTQRGSTLQGTPWVVNGVSYGTISDYGNNGYLIGKFTVPAGVPCGKAELVLTYTNSLGEEHSGKAVYTASGTLLTTTVTNTTTITQRYKVLTEVDNLYKSDPVAQSFVMSRTNDCTLTKIGIYFATKSSVRPVIIQVRNMVNGYPGERVLAEVSLNPEDINIPSNANNPVVTNVVLNQPVYCKADTFYCFCILSDSNDYSVYKAEMGKNLLGKSYALTYNPYEVGVLFSSSNASTWTAHQSEDLKFILYKSVFTGGGEIIFNDVSTSTDITGLMLDAAYEVDGGNTTNSANKTGITWYYRFSKTSSMSGGGDLVSDWLPIDTLVYRDLQSIAKTVSLKAVITTDSNTSPFIDRGRVSLRSFTDAKTGSYISKHLMDSDFEEPYQALKISYLASLPQNSEHDVYYMDDENGADGDTNQGGWIKLETDDTLVGDGTSNKRVTVSVTKYDEDYYKYTWTVNRIKKVINDPTSDGSTFFKLRIDLKTSVRYNRPKIKQLAVIFKNVL